MVSASAPAVLHRGDRGHAHDWHVKTHVLRRLGHLHDTAAGACQLARARDRRIGPFHAFDGHHRAILDDDGLADIDARDRVRDAIAKLEVGLPSRSWAGHQSARQVWPPAQAAARWNSSA